MLNENEYLVIDGGGSVEHLSKENMEPLCGSKPHVGAWAVNYKKTIKQRKDVKLPVCKRCLNSAFGKE